MEIQYLKIGNCVLKKSHVNNLSPEYANRTISPEIKWQIQEVRPAYCMLKSDWLKSITFNQVNNLLPYLREKIVHLVQMK